MRAENVALTLLGVLAVACLPRPAMAQTPKLELSGGYALMVDDITGLIFPVGWVAGVAGKLNGWLSGVGEIGAHKRTTHAIGSELRFNATSFMGGVKASGKIGPFTEFGQFLVGLVRAQGTAFQISGSRSAYGLQAGVGLDYAMNRKLAGRLQVDFRGTLAGEDGLEPGRQVRLVAGIVLTFR